MTFLSAGESHGPQLTGILEGLPAGMVIDFARLAADLAERQKGLGRGGRMKIEQDRCVITAGVRHGRTLGSPIAFHITNRDWENWKSVMSVTVERPEPSSARESELSSPRTVPRPGHADLAGAQKYDFDDLRNVLERASARETAVRVAAGALAKMFLSCFGVETACHVIRIGAIALKPVPLPVAAIRARTALSDVRCVDHQVSEVMRAEIRAAAAAADTLGGVVEVVASGVVPGLGDHTQWNKKLDGRLAQAVMSVHSIKSVEIGDGWAQAARRGSTVHDEIHYDDQRRPERSGFVRKTNRAGGLEGGLTNGADLVVRAAAKPLSTLNKPLASVDIHTKEAAAAFVERSDICSVPAAAVVCEAMVALVLADAYLSAFGGGGLDDVRQRCDLYVARLDRFGRT
ncbi:MAG: chorismate synthase [candidate division Zixibacteria bacterium]|nr:chorismate synthase [candidate division Zixibacteria bacterium]